MEKNNYFFKVLSFDRAEKCKVAEFEDKFGNRSKVVTTFNAIIPGLRYSCKLGKRYQEEVQEDGTSIRVYKLFTFRVWIDDVQVLTEGDLVKIMLENKEVEALTFGYGFSLSVDDRVKELRDYFKHKTFQLSSGKDIDKFVSVYKDACENLSQNVESNKKKFKK